LRERGATEGGEGEEGPGRGEGEDGLGMWEGRRREWAKKCTTARQITSKRIMFHLRFKSRKLSF